jgi:hypothetical protein
MWSLSIAGINTCAIQGILDAIGGVNLCFYDTEVTHTFASYT